MMKHGRYVAVIEYDAEEDSFYGRVVNVSPGHFDFWGSSVEELHREFAESARQFEEFSAEQGVPFEVTQPPSAASLAASAMGRRTSSAKAAAVRENGKKGGRPRKQVAQAAKRGAGEEPE